MRDRLIGLLVALAAIIGLWLVMLLAGCKSHKEIAAPPVVTVHDTVRVASRYVETVRIDTVRVEVALPVESEAVTIRDTLSRLENTAAWSLARINADGSLYHFLGTKQTTLSGSALVPAVTVQTDSTARETREVPVEVERKVEVPAELTAWQRFRLSAFWWLAGLSIALLMIIKYRK